MGSATPTTQEGGTPALPILGVLFRLCAHPLSQNYTKSDVVTHVGEERESWGQHRLPSQESRVPALNNFGVSTVLMLHLLLQNDQI